MLFLSVELDSVARAGEIVVKLNFDLLQATLSGHSVLQTIVGSLHQSTSTPGECLQADRDQSSIQTQKMSTPAVFRPNLDQLSFWTNIYLSVPKMPTDRSRNLPSLVKASKRHPRAF